MAAPYLLLVNSSLKQYIGELPADERRRLREKLEYLENGLWDGGVRVKKLHGTQRQVVFEARLNRADRLLFTLGREVATTAIYVWGLYAHDDVDRGARQIAARQTAAGRTAAGAMPENAPFLLFAAESIEEHDELLIDSLEPAYFTQEPIEQKARGDYGPQKWLVVDEDEWRRIVDTADPAGLEIYLHLTPDQSHFLNQEPPLLLSGTAGSGKTTISLYYLARTAADGNRRLFLTYSPYLKRFSETLYDGLVRNRRRHEPVAGDSATAADRPAGGQPPAGRPPSDRPQFKMFRELLNEIVTAAGTPVDPESEVRPAEFDALFRDHGLYGRYDSELVWEEIRSIIKGANPPFSVTRFEQLVSAYESRQARPRELNELVGYLIALRDISIGRKLGAFLERKSTIATIDRLVLAVEQPSIETRDAVREALDQALRLIEKRAKSFDRPMIDYDDYELLGKKRAPNFMFDRKELYSIAEFYQQRLESARRWDQIDLTRAAIRALSRADDLFQYDLVVCDEIQDFADIELSLIFLLAKNPRNLVLTGDPRQIVNPSGFRWEEVRAKFYERGTAVPDVHHLRLNFRCAGALVQLSNALLTVKQRLAGVSGSELREDWKFAGRPPLVLHSVPEKAVLGRIGRAMAGSVVLVRDAAIRDRLKRELSTELVFTITEAKGLEFDTVLVWEFCGTAKQADLWRRVVRNGAAEPEHVPHIRHELNLLYVATTRARNTLVFYEGRSRSELWSLPELDGLVLAGSELEALSQIWQRVSSPEEWEIQGRYFMDREHYAAAEECFKNAGNAGLAELAAAYRHRVAHDWAAAAPLFEKHGEFALAAACYQSAAVWGKAAKLWKKVGDAHNALVCSIELQAANGDWRAAGAGWFKLGDINRAIDAYRKVGDHRRLAELYLSIGDGDAAAAAFEKVGDFAGAAECRLRLKQVDQAAELFFRAKRFDRAAPLFKKLKNDDRLLVCYDALNDVAAATAICYRKRDFAGMQQRVRVFAAADPANRRAMETAAAARTTARLRAALIHEAIGNDSVAAATYDRLREFDRAAACHARAGEHEHAARTLAFCRRYLEAATQLEHLPNAAFEQVAEYINRYISGNKFPRGIIKERAEEIAADAGALLDAGQYRKALPRCLALGDYGAVADCFLNLEDHVVALRFFCIHAQWEHMIDYLRRKRHIHFTEATVSAVLTPVIGQESIIGTEQGNRRIEAVSHLLLAAVPQVGADSIRELANRWFAKVYHYSLERGTSLPPVYADLLIAVTVYRNILEVVRVLDVAHGPNRHPSVEEFGRRVCAEAETRNDPVLRACCGYATSAVEFERRLADVPLNDETLELFAASAVRYREAADFLVGRGFEDAAAALCRSHGNLPAAAEILEQAGELVEAGRLYRDSVMYQRALDCFKRAGNDIERARVYERMRKWDAALAIWKQRGRTRDIQRVEKRIAQGAAAQSQRELF